MYDVGTMKQNHTKRKGDEMDLRFNYDHIRLQIDTADFGDYLGNDSNIVKDIRKRMHLHIDTILSLEQKIKEYENMIKDERIALKELAEQWDV